MLIFATAVTPRSSSVICWAVCEKTVKKNDGVYLGSELIPGQPTLFIPVRHWKAFLLEMLEQIALMLRSPSVPVTLPARITTEDASIKFQLMAFVSVWALLVFISAHITLEHKLFFSHTISFLVPNVAFQRPRLFAVRCKSLVKFLQYVAKVNFIVCIFKFFCQI